MVIMVLNMSFCVLNQYVVLGNYHVSFSYIKLALIIDNNQKKAARYLGKLDQVKKYFKILGCPIFLLKYCNLNKQFLGPSMRTKKENQVIQVL
jgi:hypothetical protein